MIYDVTPVPRKVEPPAAKAKVAQEPRDIAANFIDSYQQLWRQPFDASTSAKGIDLPRTGRSDLGSILFDNAMFQIESAVEVCRQHSHDAQERLGCGERSPIRNRATASPAWCRRRRF